MSTSTDASGLTSQGPIAPPAPAPAQGSAVPRGAPFAASIRAQDRELRAIVQVPDVVPPAVVPVLVIAPGQGYHMGLSLVRGLFERMAAECWAVVRFDWAFHTAHAEPSKGYVHEVQELEAVVGYARDLPGVDRSRLYIAGKSLGAGVALERASADPSIRGVILLTPPIHTPKPAYKMGTVRPRLERLRQPALIVVGEQDPLCEIGRLYGLVANIPHAPHIAVTGGDHSLRGPFGTESARNVDLALAHAADWLRRQAMR